MRYLLIILSLFLFSCSEEDDCPTNCGVITADEISDDCYSLTIRNDCSDNYETFCFDYDVWFTNYVGDNLCVSNVTDW